MVLVQAKLSFLEAKKGQNEQAIPPKNALNVFFLIFGCAARSCKPSQKADKHWFFCT